MHCKRWAGQFRITNMFFLHPAKRDLRRWRKGREGRGEGKRGKGRRNWNRNPSQWIKKQDSSFCLVVQPCIFPTRHRSSLCLCFPALQHPRDDWYARRAKLATETEKIMHKRWVQFIVFSWGPRGEPKLWIYAVCDWMRAWTRGTDVALGGGGKGGFEVQSKNLCRTGMNHLMTSGGTCHGCRDSLVLYNLHRSSPHSLQWNLAS